MLAHYKQIERIANVSFLMNKWAMWADSNLPDNATYTPAVFQTRDAFFHIMKFFYYGFLNGDLKTDDLQTINEYFQREDNMQQLYEAFHHIARAFFDIADHIFLEIEKEERPAERYKEYLLLNKKLAICKEELKILRAAKSNSEKDTYLDISKWDNILSILTAAYTVSKKTITLEKLSYDIDKVYIEIEEKHEPETIERHDNQFFEMKTKKKDWSVSPIAYIQYLKESDLEVSDPQEWSKQLLADVDQREKELTLLYNHLVDLNMTMMSSTRFLSRKKRDQAVTTAFYAIIQVAIGAVLTVIIERSFFTTEVIDAAGEAAYINLSFVLKLILFVSCLICCNLLYRFISKRLALHANRRRFRQSASREAEQ